LVKQIEVAGNKRIDARMLLSKLAIKEGDPFSYEAVQNEIKKLYQMGIFRQIEAVTTDFEGGISLLFVVKEEPLLSEIAFEGNHNIQTDTLKTKLSLKPQTPLNREAIAQEVVAISDHYQKEGYVHVSVIPILNALSDNQISLTFLIQENDPVYVRTIRFNGVVSFREKALKKKINTKEYFWFPPWVSESERYQEGKLAVDREMVKEFYLNNGYLQVQVGKPIVTFLDDKESIEITFPVTEGEPFQIEKVVYDGNLVIESGALSAVTSSQSNARFSKETVGNDVRKMTDLYGEKGYLYANVMPDLIPNLEKKTVVLTFRVIEGVPYHVRNIHIRGNDKTRDKVIRREIRQNEQETVNTQLLKRSIQRIHNLNFFEIPIHFEPKRVSDSEVDLYFNVQEKSTGTLSLGGGYGSVDGFVGQFDINQGNLFGRGHLLRANIEFGDRRNQYNLTFREPYLLDSTFSGQVDLFNRSRTFESYKEKRVGGSLIIGKALGEYTKGSVNYTLETLRVSDLKSTAPLFVQTQSALGKTLTSAVGFSIARDTTDFTFDPKKGTRHSLSLEYAGTFLGGDNEYYKAVFDASRFFNPWRDDVFSIHGNIGYADGIREKVLPVGERFFVGGVYSVRGFRFGKAGPLTSEGAISGGNKELVFNAEYLMPISKESGLKWVFFYDIGAGFDDDQAIALSDLREGAGFGIRWISPMGPLRLEWGYNLNPKPSEDSTVFEFTIGTLF
jgi:outer membrane protein insertion porin family